MLKLRSAHALPSVRALIPARVTSRRSASRWHVHCIDGRHAKSSRELAMNAEWHATHRMPRNPTVELRVAWHLDHARHCDCRRMPARLAALARSQRLPKADGKPSKKVRTANPPASAPMPEGLLSATTTPDVVRVPGRTVLAIDGQGAPGAEDFQLCIGALYGVTYTLKFTRKRAGKGDFKVGALESRWSAGNGEAAFAKTPREEWHWRLRLAVPQDVDRKEVAAAIAAATGKKGGKLQGSAEAARVRLERVPAGRWGRILHIGPYAAEGRSIAKVTAAIEKEGAVVGGDHVEVYLSDPRRTSSAKVRTVLLLSLN